MDCSLVSIRRIAGAAATLFAGCGIVADSDAAAEYQETLAKGRAFCDALAPTSRPVATSPAPAG